MASSSLNDEDLQICQQTNHFANTILHPLQHQLNDVTGIPVWTRNRHDLGEALDYCTLGEESECIIDGAVTACIVDTDSGLRTYLDSEVIIFQIAARVKCGPGRTAYRNKKQEIHQSYEVTLAAAQPLVVIIGSNFPSTTLQLPEQFRYVVLDHFRITNIWAEQRATTIEHMVRLEKCHLKTSSWWTPYQPDPPEFRNYTLLKNNASPFPVCQSCAIACPQVYSEAWMCLIESCDFFWTQNDQNRSNPPEVLTFNSDFLRFRRHLATSGTPPYALVPDLLSNIRALEGSGQIVSRLSMLYRGVICPHCHNIVPKIYWHVWACTECQARFEEGFNPGQIRLQALIPRNFTSFTGHPTLNKARWPSVNTHQGPMYRDLYRIDKWTLHRGGQLIIFSPSSKFNDHPDGPNTIYDNLLADANAGNPSLQRYEDVKQGTLDSYFHSLFGAEYSFDPIHAAVPFGQTPQSVLNGMKLLRDAATAELRHNYGGSNSCEVRAFLEGMKIRWHSDGGQELGDTVSTLVLGSDAVFRMRMQKYYWENTGALHPDGEVVMGAKNWQKVFEVRRKMLAGQPLNEPNYSYNTSSDSVQRPEIVVPVIHGSIIILQGPASRKYYEHMLEMTGPMGFSITTRLVDEDLRSQVDGSRRINGPRFFSSNERYTWDDSDDSNLDSDVMVDDSVDEDDNEENNHDGDDDTSAAAYDHKLPGTSGRTYRNRTDPRPPRKVSHRSRNRSMSPFTSRKAARPAVASPIGNRTGPAATGTRFVWTAERLNTLLSLRNDQHLSWDDIRTTTGWTQTDDRLHRVEREERARRTDERTQQRRDAGLAPLATGGGDGGGSEAGRGAAGRGGRSTRSPAPGVYSGWTQEEMDQVTQLREQNFSWAEVAVRMGGRRTAAAYKSRWLTFKKREREGTAEPLPMGSSAPSSSRDVTPAPASVRGARGGGGGTAPRGRGGVDTRRGRNSRGGGKS